MALSLKIDLDPGGKFLHVFVVLLGCANFQAIMYMYIMNLKQSFDILEHKKSRFNGNINFEKEAK